MPGTYSQLLCHLVFSTKHRTPWITRDIEVRLHSYLTGIIHAQKGTVLAIGGIEDHVHLCIRWRPDETLSNLMRSVKANSSKWIHTTMPHLAAFAWQEGYAAFSISRSQQQAVESYIARQREHHRRDDFRTELLKLLRSHEIEFEDRYVFD